MANELPFGFGGDLLGGTEAEMSDDPTQEVDADVSGPWESNWIDLGGEG